jgi:hypothetical protein
MGHHLIRSCVFKYYINKYLMNENIKNNKGKLNYSEQYIAELYGITKLSISYFEYINYYDEIGKAKDNKIYFPVLIFGALNNTKYNKYKEIIKLMIVNIQNKIKNSFKKDDLPILCPIEIVILYHIIFIRRDGRYSEISIMDLYSLIYCYDECSNEFSNNHNCYNCLCKKCFTAGNKNIDSTKYKDIRQSIVNHYENIKQIENISINYTQYIKEKYNENFKYNHEHIINYKYDNPNFSIKNKGEIIGYSDNHIIYFILSSQMNTLNFNEKLLEGIINKYIILNTVKTGDSKNHEKYLNKQIHLCLLTLDSLNPIFIDFNIDKDNEYLNKSFDKILTKKYISYHNDIHNFCINYEKRKPNKEKNPAKFIFDRLEEESKLPKYIKDYFNNIQNEVKGAMEKKLPVENIKEILNKYRDKELFLKEIGICLKTLLDEYIYNIKVEEEINEEYVDL